MSEEKKYSAKEAAVAVLKKAEEMLKKHEAMKKSAAVGNSDGPAPKGEIHPKEPQVGESENPGQRIEDNAKQPVQPDAKVNSNPEWGTAPETYGTLKLAKFIGHIHSKRKRSNQSGVI